MQRSAHGRRQGQEGDMGALLPPARFDLLTLDEVDLAEVPNSGPVTHREWLTIARKTRAC
jgi:hypothetical protein